MKVVWVLFLFFTTYTVAEKVSYKDYSVYKLTPRDELSVQKLKYLEKTAREYDFWTPVRTKGTPVDVLVPPTLKNEFLKLIKPLNVQFEVKINNVQELIDRSSVRKHGKSAGITWDAYYTIEEIYDWLASLPDQYKTVSLIQAGTTYEGRNLTGVKVSFNENNANRSVFIEANIHAREWITNAVATYILNQVLTSQDADFRKLVESFDWYIVPVVNPDGYAYTHSTERFWRKTRVPYGDDCYGADPNRNWDYHWDEGGADDEPCSEAYAGPKPFSEPSTLSLSQYLASIAKNLTAYIAFHSYSQLLMVPYGYTYDKLDNYDVTVPLAGKAVEALQKRYGTQYEYGNIAETIYVASGNSLDWIKGTHQVPYSYVYELRDQGEYGFVLPPEFIIPTGEETLDSVVVILQGALANPSGRS